MLHQKVMSKSHLVKSKNEQYVFCDTISRSKQGQLELFLEAFNAYFGKRLARGNFQVEVGCSFARQDLFEPFLVPYVVQNGKAVKMTEPVVVDHKEGEVLVVTFVPSR